MNRREFLRILAMSAAGAVLPVDSIKAAKETKVKSLENLKWRPRWVSHLGCIEGCLKYLKMDVSPAWLYGGTGHAFIINMAEDCCPSGPTAWKTVPLFELGRNLGYLIDGVFGSKRDQDLAELQVKAWDYIKSAIDQDLPCYGWELDIPEWYVIHGYDEVGYYFSGPGCDDGKGPKPWGEVGDTGIGWLEMYSIEPCEAAEVTEIVKETFEFVLKHAQNPKDWIYPNYGAGLKGYDIWIKSLQAGTAARMGHAYNTAVWEECRRYGVEFLSEAKERLGGDLGALFDTAIGHYEQVAAGLKTVTELYPFGEHRTMEPVGVNDNSQTAAEDLTQVREAEAAGLASLEEILPAI